MQPRYAQRRQVARDRAAQAVFVFTFFWDFWEPIGRFAPERAVYYPEDAEFLLSMEPGVERFEVVVDERA